MSDATRVGRWTQTAPARSLSPNLIQHGLIVDQHRACPDFDRQRYGLTFSEVQLGKRDRVLRA